MAKITLTIEAEGPSDLHEALADLCDRLEGAGSNHVWQDKTPANFPGLDGERQAEFTDEDIARIDHEAIIRGGDAGEQPTEGKRRRRRRTKAALEADPLWRAKNGLPPLSGAQSAVSASPSSGSATSAPTGSAANLDFTRLGSSKPSSAGAPAAEPQKALFGIGGGAATQPQVQAQPAGDTPEAALKAAFRQSMATRGAKATQELLIATAGVRMTAELKPEQFAAVTAAFLGA